MEFELKIREPIWAKFDLIWILGAWELQNFMGFGMWGPNYTWLSCELESKEFKVLHAKFFKWPQALIWNI
jgi:hypothetical protein